jgi:hypothetical protein
VSTLNFNRVVLECDGCKKRHGEPHGHGSSREARIAAYIDGWRFPPMVKANGHYGERTNDVCDDCSPTWVIRQWRPGSSKGRHLMVDEAPRPEEGR